MKFPTIITNDSVTILVNNKPYAFRRGDAQYANVVAAIKANRWDEIKRIVDIPSTIKRESRGKLLVQDGAVYFNGETIHNTVVDRIIKFKDEGLPFKPLLNFLARLLKNPEPDSIQQLYKFAEHEHLPITETGMLLGYKYVTKNMLSTTCGKDGKRIQYKLGKITSMPRDQVMHDPNTACGPGLHVGSLEYALAGAEEGSGNKVIIVEVDPANAVSVPVDSSFQKLRTCALKPVAVYTGPLNKPCYKVSNKTNTVTPKRGKDGRFLPKKHPKGEVENPQMGSLYRVVGIRRKVFRLKGINLTKEHGKRLVVEHHNEKCLIIPTWRLKKASKQEVEKYLTS